MLKENQKSILRKDRQIIHDRLLIRRLVNNFVVGEELHLNSCTDKIMHTIQSLEWQNRFTHVDFVFLINESIGSLSSISMFFSCQILEVFYYFLGGDNPDDKPFDLKVRFVFKKIYNIEMNPNTAQVLRFIRNNMAHTINIEGIEDTRKKTDKEFAEKFCTDYGFQSTLDGLRHLSFEFSYLIQQTCLIIMGLDIENFCFNLRLPQHSSYFKKIIKSKSGLLDKL